MRMRSWWLGSLLVLPLMTASAADWDVSYSAGASRTPAAGGRVGPVIFADAVRQSDQAWQVQPALSLGVIGGKGTARDQADRTVGVLAGGVRITSPWGLFLQEQGAVIGPRTQALSSTGQFVSSLGWQGERLSVQVRHISNGGAHGRNAGETMALLGWRF